ncbi:MULTISPECIES: hypothetical protein [unclassified Leptolyngbya]|uniref:hypothetical protein n=1 Tax=unclassified Leptolyngbya TaxID=2650499 RepID=UPI001685CD14|nr:MULTISPECIES: hypothetical protein [unclassified Leptolyngbya]MBD1909417.1 hypothetical protein [Leptolyngbya sp. FACHB-8]MBD2157596.1 hypothetical protein [Leptolyngbya sp. FACHB-16]
MIQEVFIESPWEDESIARQRRDERYGELAAAGLDCRRENLYTVDGRRVFLVIATPAEEEVQISPSARDKPTAPRLRAGRPVRRIQGYETR